MQTGTGSEIRIGTGTDLCIMRCRDRQRLKNQVCRQTQVKKSGKGTGTDLCIIRCRDRHRLKNQVCRQAQVQKSG